MINRRIVKAYKKLLPETFRSQISIIRNASDFNTIRKDILSFYSFHPSLVNNEIQDVLNFLTNHPLRLFPYAFPNKYKPDKIKVYKDSGTNLNYVFHEDKRLYFKRGWTKDMIEDYYSGLLIEQDVASPHRYLANDFTVRQNDVVADIGCAEGIFALSVVERSKQIYLFETDGGWTEPLRATFGPWIEKVFVVNRFVSDKSNDRSIVLDEFCKTEEIRFDFIKIDVDGAETALLTGCQEILTDSRELKVAICTYHKADDERKFKALFEKNGFSIGTSKGFMIFFHDRNLAPPYLRRGVLRAMR